jgi:hypothetical protein
MSKGSRFVGIRLPEPLWSRFLEAVASNNQTKHGEPWNMATWIVDAMWAKLAHQSRAKVQGMKRRKGRRPLPDLPI